METELKPCPFCGSTHIKVGAFNISPDCYIVCNDCGASIEKMVDWGNMNVAEHDQKCWSVLAEAWNRRAAKTPCDLCKFNPPSSMDGKPCTMCVVDGRNENAN